jgi:hypothetical protein
MLIATTREQTSIGRTYFNSSIWKPALMRAGVRVSRENGTHALRHFDAGFGPKEVARHVTSMSQEGA